MASPARTSEQVIKTTDTDRRARHKSIFANVLVATYICPRGSAYIRDNKAQFYIFYFIFVYLIQLLFGTPFFQLSSSLLQMNIVLRPSRTRHNRDTGADVQ